MQTKPEQKILARNKKARHDYHIDETYETGIALMGSEVKSLRAGGASLTDGYAVIRNGELWLVGIQISEYTFSHARNHMPRRERKLLMHKQEIHRLGAKIHEKGYTLIPLELYLKGSKVKVALGLARGKQAYDKRHATRKRDLDREVEAELARRK